VINWILNPRLYLRTKVIGKRVEKLYDKKYTRLLVDGLGMTSLKIQI
jgi:hypothetical protein